MSIKPEPLVSSFCEDFYFPICGLIGVKFTDHKKSILFFESEKDSAAFSQAISKFSKLISVKDYQSSRHTWCYHRKCHYVTHKLLAPTNYYYSNLDTFHWLMSLWKGNTERLHFGYRRYGVMETVNIRNELEDEGIFIPTESTSSINSCENPKAAAKETAGSESHSVFSSDSNRPASPKTAAKGLDSKPNSALFPDKSLLPPKHKQRQLIQVETVDSQSSRDSLFQPMDSKGQIASLSPISEAESETESLSFSPLTFEFANLNLCETPRRVSKQFTFDLFSSSGEASQAGTIATPARKKISDLKKMHEENYKPLPWAWSSKASLKPDDLISQKMYQRTIQVFASGSPLRRPEPSHQQQSKYESKKSE